MSELRFIETETDKKVRSEVYNYNFNKITGEFVRWGKTFEDDPLMAPFPEILDIEVEERCNGVPGLNGIESPCAFCYKKATSKTGRTMTFETFRKVFDNTFLDKENKKFSFLTQIAFGADAGAKYNKDLFKMMQYSRDNGVIPNITVANVDDETADKLSEVCGAVSVSVYQNKNIAYDTIKRLTDRGMKQVNIHVMLSEETADRVMEVFHDFKEDSRLSKLNAIVILSLKKRGRGVSYATVSPDRFKAIVDYALDKGNNIPLGFDSCTCGKFSDAIQDYSNYKQIMLSAEPCESTLFSQYINVEGKFYSCSFCENAESFPVGVDAVNVDDYIKDVWMHPSTVAWRNNLLEKRKAGSMTCPVYEV